MKLGAASSGVAHVLLITAMIVGGEFYQEAETFPLEIAEVDLMTGAEFDAALSASPEFNPDQPSSLAAPDETGERADVKVAAEDLAPSRTHVAIEPDAPTQGEDVLPLQDTPVQAAIADVGERMAAPPAPDDDILIATPQEILDTPTAAIETPTLSAPQAAAAPVVETTAPEPEPEPVVEATPEVMEAPAEELTPEEPKEPEVETPAIKIAEAPAPEPAPEPAPQVTEEVLEPVEPEQPDDELAPLRAPPPPKKPADVARAKQEERLAQAAAASPEEGAVKQAEAPTGAGSSATVGQLSFRDRDALRVGIKGFFNPPPGLANPETLLVTIRIELSDDGKIKGKPVVRRPRGRLDAANAALMRAGMRALHRAAGAGVFKRLPKDKYAKWRLIDVTFTPKEIRFL